ncbi:DUF4982 domain-containing protein [Paenibacillus sp. LMG 31461]|uniref:DUF4982 domain-containing protein n=1 Tax=Paenibacillus plantarum TaxID=2654975 RepID=A0ABX1X274_9BACL|nr:beta-galactosidase GalA [Paenibacillus plantarum]NOU62505.1 DUF4982 domain-containing protein [Paenibacillus plantarum]
MDLQTVRTKNSFDADWLFHKGDIPIRYAVKAGMTGGITDCEKMEEGDWLDIAFVDKSVDADTVPKDWVSVHLPHDWCIEGDYINDPNLGSRPASSGYLPTGIGMYVKVFDIARDDLGKKINLEFDGVMRNSTVWVNGHLMGRHTSGYTSFIYDLSDVLRYGDEGKNVVCVKVDATESEGWWYEGCGIYRHVWLTKTERVHVAHWGTYVTTPVVTESHSDVRIQTSVENTNATSAAISVTSTIIDGQTGETVGSVSSEGSIEPITNLMFEQTVRVAQPKLWSPDTPHLYQVLTEIRNVEGAIVDTYETTFGIRTIEFTPDRGFFLNGKPLIIKGTCNHQDFAGVGVALPDRIIAYKIELLKEMGSNTYRSAHHPATPELLDACDRLGMMVIEENRKLDSSPEGIDNLKRMLYRGRNHPSIIMWSMENEEILEGTVMGARILQTLSDVTHTIDPTRPTTAALNHGWNGGGYAEAVDIVGYNYGQREDQDVNDHITYPDRIMIGSESASCTTTRGIYETDEIRGYVPAYGTVYPSWGCTPEKAWTDVVQNPFLTGIVVWTGFDYRGEPTPYEWPCINSHFGIMDTCGFPKDSYYYYKSVWTNEPVLHIMPHWNWEGREGESIHVQIYSNCDAVELRLNDISLGRKMMIPNSHLAWDVPYEPGELTATGYKDDVAILVKRVATADAPNQIKLMPDRTTIQRDGTDVVVVRVAVADAWGRIVPTADNEILFTVEGSGTIIGVGNGNPSSHESDKSNRRKVFNGYCLVLVQSNGAAGTIRLRASSVGLVTEAITIETV